MRHYFLLAGLLVWAVGCGSSKIAPVSGRVTMGDKPLVNATVIFQPISDEKNPGPGSQGKTDREGRFTLQTMTGNQKGAIIGKHRIMITAYEGDTDEIPSSGSDNKVFAKRIVADEYNANSKLTFDVPAGGTTEANFDLPEPAPEKK